MTLIADGFLAGSLLTLLLPVALLIALVYWYVKFIRRVPETREGEGAAAAATAGNPGTASAPVTPGSPATGTPPGGASPAETSHHPGEI